MRKLLGLALAVVWPFAGLANDDAVREAAERIEAEAGGHRIVVVGETHGTREPPAVVAALARRYAAQGPVLVGLEIGREEHAALSAYMRSNGDRTARARLRESAFWDVPPEENDGRRTEEMLDLVEALRALRAEGRDVALFPFDIAPGAFVDPAARDRDMADHLRTAFAALPRGRLLVLTGNVHARLSPPAVIDDGRYRTATQLLQDLRPLAVDLTAAGGEAWICATDPCGPTALAPRPRVHGPAEGYDFRFVLPEFTPARPLGPGKGE